MTSSDELPSGTPGKSTRPVGEGTVATAQSAPPKARAFDSLTGMRAAAAFIVFGDHAGAGEQGAMGVTFFFILSGFVLTWSHDGRTTRSTFWFRRLVRIYPAYLVAALLGVYLAPKLLVAPLIATLTLTQSWVPDPRFYFSYDGVSWSLSCEAFFYFVFPFVIPVLARLTKRKRWIVALSSLAVMFLLPAVGIAAGGTTGQSWLVGKLPLTRLLEFLLGILLALEFKSGRRLSRPWLWLACAGAIYASGWVSITPYTTIAGPSIFLCAIILASATRDAADKKWIFSSKVVVWLGKISFCFYLLHAMVISELRLLGLPQVVKIPVYLTVSIGAAAILHYAVERPIEKRLRQWWNDRASHADSVPCVVEHGEPAANLNVARGNRSGTTSLTSWPNARRDGR